VELYIIKEMMIYKMKVSEVCFSTPKGCSEV
jgi:hypothetical protein